MSIENIENVEKEIKSRAKPEKRLYKAKKKIDNARI